MNTVAVISTGADATRTTGATGTTGATLGYSASRSPRRRAALHALICVEALLLAACSTFSGSGRSVSYSQTAQSNYDKGAAELKDDNYAEAVKYFTFVKNRFPFSRYATLAELRIADALFSQEKYTPAIDAYKLFAKFHPTHPKVTDGYVAYRICQGYVKQIPSDWFLIPPSHEKDQTATREAVRELVIFLRSQPGSRHTKQVQQLYRKTLRRLVAHELYVARFYLSEDKPKATILRLEGVLARYPQAGIDAEVMLLLGKTYLKLNQKGKAKQTFASLVKKYPADASASKARLYLRYLNKQ